MTRDIAQEPVGAKYSTSLEDNVRSPQQCLRPPPEVQGADFLSRVSIHCTRGWRNRGIKPDARTVDERSMIGTLSRVLLGLEQTRPGAGEPGARPKQVESVIVPIAGVSFVAGLIHVGASIDHYQEFPLYTPAFALMAAFQIAWAMVVVRRPSRGVLTLGVACNAVIVALWGASRIVGMPIASDPWVPEPIGAPDFMATVAESTIVVTSFLLISVRSAVSQRLLSRLGPMLLVVLLLSVLYGVGRGHAG